MRRVAITGIGCLSAAGVGRQAMRDALRAGRALGADEQVPALRDRRSAMRVARIPPFDREAFLGSRKMRRMGEVSQLWVIACLLARADAGLAEQPGVAPERRGTYLGTGFGCIDTTWDYLVGMFRDGAGMANPFLFSESVANAPAGHAALELDTRGASVSFTCGDASAAAAVLTAARAVRDGRVDLAWCGGIELLSPPLLRVLASLKAPSFVGEGAACFVLESMEGARARNARIHAEIAGWACGSDPAAAATDWGRDPDPIARTIRQACERAGETPPRIYLHASGSPLAEQVERDAAGAALPGAIQLRAPAVFGSLAAAGALSLAAAATDPPCLLSACSWGGATYALALRPAAPPGPLRTRS